MGLLSGWIDKGLYAFLLTIPMEEWGPHLKRLEPRKPKIRMSYKVIERVPKGRAIIHRRQA